MSAEDQRAKILAIIDEVESRLSDAVCEASQASRFSLCEELEDDQTAVDAMDILEAVEPLLDELSSRLKVAREELEAGR